MNPFWPPHTAASSPSPMEAFARWWQQAAAAGAPFGTAPANPLAPPFGQFGVPGAGGGSAFGMGGWPPGGFDGLGPAQAWWQQIQQLAQSLGAVPGDAAQVAERWRQMLEGQDNAPFAQVFQGLDATGANGFSQWYAAMRPMLDAWRKQIEPWLAMPAVGFAREHQERLQALARALVEYQDAQVAFQAVLAQASEQSFAVFETLLRARSAPGEQLTSARALFDLWIEAAEQAFANVALSPQFRHAYGAMTNAQMRLRKSINGEIERAAAACDLPTRTELDSAHRRIAELERSLRRMERAAKERAAAPSQADAGARVTEGSAAPAPAAAAAAAAAQSTGTVHAPAHGKGKGKHR